MITKSCPNCGAKFSTYPSVNAKFCGSQCSREHRSKEHRRKKERPCKICGRVFVPKHPKSPGIYCSYSCRGIDSRAERVKRNGYWFVCKPDHPRSSSQGYVGEHVLVAEQCLSRYLRPDEVVHHVNHIKDDNRPENLQVMLDADHRAMHLKESIDPIRKELASRTSQRLKANNPVKNALRGPDGRFVSKL